jgi:hypothetical protein
MYAQLGSIVFEALKGFDSLSDTRETLYAEHALIKGKPLLQRVGESLTEFTGSIHFHVGFCNPEDEYKKLNDARQNGEILPFIYGNSFIEGDFVITTLGRVINQTDTLGNFIDITCDITLREFISSNSDAIQKERDKSNAFAISSNRPLPSNPNTQPDNPSLSVMNENNKVGIAGTNVNSENKKLNNKILGENTNPPISKAQLFVDSIPVYTQKINAQLTTANVSLSSLTNLISLYPKILIESPSLNTVIVNSQNSIIALTNQNTILSGLPTTISTVPTALSVLNQLFITTNLTIAFIQTIKDLNDANSKIAVALTFKKNLK